MRVLVGVDGSPASLAALGWSGRVATRTGGDVVVAHVLQPVEAEVSPHRADDLRRETEQRIARDWSEPVRASGAEHTSLVLEGDPDALLDAADDVGADLIVVGPRGRGGFASLRIGSVAHHLAHHTRRPLAIVPEPGADADIGRVIIGVDGSEASAAAVAWCADTMTTTDVEFVAVHAFEQSAWMTPDSPLSALRREADGHVEGEWVAPLRAAGHRVTTAVVDQDHPVTALAEAIDDNNAGVAVVGTRGIGGFVGLRVGRVPLQLVHHTQVPVVLVPAPSTDATESIEVTTAP